MKILGIDEAGRGCVLGDLVVSGFLVEGVSDAALLRAGAGDSKAMSAARRQAAREELQSHGLPDIRRISPRQIDQGNLNQLEERVIVDLVRTHQPDLVLIDALGHPATLPGLVARLQAQIGPGPELRAEPRADATFPVVGAASIFAKTTRDALLDTIRERHPEIGSGYPSDPRTRRWLEAWARTGAPWPAFVRTRWQTVAALAQTRLPV